METEIVKIPAELLCVCMLPSVRDTTEDVETVGDHSQMEDDVTETPFVDAPSKNAMATTEASTERKEEPRPDPPPVKRDPCTPPPPSLPAKLLTRLGSLDGV